MLNRAIEILLIEDNPADADLTKEALQKFKRSVNIQVSSSGDEALLYLRKRGKYSEAIRPDIVFLDLNLPGLDGREVLREIRNDNVLKSIPVLILTSSEADLDILKAYSLGANCYIVKPVAFNQFIEIIHKTEDFWFNMVRLPSPEITDRYHQNEPQKTTNHDALAPPFSPIQVRVLLVEDSDPDADLVMELLKDRTSPTFDLSRVSRLSDALHHLSEQVTDIVLLDLSLPDSYGVDTLELLLKNVPQVPVVVLTGFDDQSFGLRAVKSGAQDYLVKGQVTSNLISRVLLYAIERKTNELERTATLQRELTARDQAEKAVGIRDEFLSVASHELKTPLTALKIQIELLKKVIAKIELPEEIKNQCLRVIHGTEYDVNRVIHLVYTLLDFSQIQSGRLQLNYSNFEISELVNYSIERLSREIEAVKCKVYLKSQKPIFGTWDRFRVEQIIANLLTNAAKYAPGKPIEISIDQTHSDMILKIRDYGIGIAPENRDRIFHRFERAIDPSQKGVSGFGLGLYIVRQIVDAHGGSIHVESQRGKGSTFQVCLPLKPVHFSHSKNQPAESLLP
jgi:signal transduction histidine kinase